MTEQCILITGANGLIGRHLLERLVQEGRRAIGIDLTPRDGRSEYSPAHLLTLTDSMR
jgi:nucleoside-diphosphate-sugar epimerase